MKQLYILIALLFMGTAVTAQELDRLVQEGINLYHQEDFAEAVVKFEQAFQIDPNHALVNYELALSYFSLADYEKALGYSDRVLSIGSEHVKESYLIKGSALDNLGRAEESIKVYKGAIFAYPDDYLLRYNLALSCYNSGNLDCAEESVLAALSYNPNHASSHLLLGYLMNDKARRVPSVLALYYFLLLEPESSRSSQAYALLREELDHGVAKTTTRRITLDMPRDLGEDAFAEADLMLSMLAASRNLEENTSKSDSRLFAEDTQAFFRVLEEKSGVSQNNLWSRLYISFFASMTNAGHTETFCYWISRSEGRKEVKDWWSGHSSEVGEFSAWSKENR